MAKGGSAEREIAKLLSLWWTEGERDDIFGRSDSSGARFTQRRKAGKDTANQGGDITFTDSIGEPLIKSWNIECKTGYGKKKSIKDENKTTIKKVSVLWDILDLIDSQQKKPVIIQFWKQCQRDACLTNRTPVLIFRRNGRGLCICFNKRYVEEMQMYFGNVFYPKLSLELEEYSLIIMSLNTFFEWIPNIKSFIKG
jgi:hypothetical protein